LYFFFFKCRFFNFPAPPTQKRYPQSSRVRVPFNGFSLQNFPRVRYSPLLCSLSTPIPTVFTAPSQKIFPSAGTFTFSVSLPLFFHKCSFLLRQEFFYFPFPLLLFLSDFFQPMLTIVALITPRRDTSFQISLVLLSSFYPFFFKVASVLAQVGMVLVTPNNLSPGTLFPDVALPPCLLFTA